MTKRRRSTWNEGEGDPAYSGEYGRVPKLPKRKPKRSPARRTKKRRS